jgi:uncharacterized protein YPO0396
MLSKFRYGIFTTTSPGKEQLNSTRQRNMTNDELQKRLDEAENTADLKRLEGRIQGIQFVIDNLCSCETCHKGRPWMKRQVEELTKRLKTLTDERTGST